MLLLEKYNYLDIKPSFWKINILFLLKKEKYLPMV